MKTLCLIMPFLAIMTDCSNIEPNFVEKYENADFSIFYGYSVYKPATPGFGRLRPVFFIEELHNSLQIRYVVELSEKRDSVLKIKKVFIRDTIPTDGVITNRAHIEEMTLQFSKFNIYSIEVDSTKNVYVKQKALENDKMIARFENEQVVDSNRWISLKGQWYREK